MLKEFAEIRQSGLLLTLNFSKLSLGYKLKLIIIN